MTLQCADGIPELLIVRAGSSVRVPVVSAAHSLFLPRYLLYVHDCWPLHAEAVPEAAPRYQRQCLQRICLLGHRHLLLRSGRGEGLIYSAHLLGRAYPSPNTLPHPESVHSSQLPLQERSCCFPKGPSWALLYSKPNPAACASRL